MPGIDLFRLDGKVALVTGGTKGLGRSMADGLASAGADVVICSRNGEEAEGEAALLGEETGRRTLGVRCDVTDPGEVEALVEATVSKLGRLDILINNAGINIRNPIEELSLEEFEEVMSVNVRGPWLCSRAAIPHMRAGGYGRVINMGSTLSVVGVPGRTPYASSKGAVAQMTRVLALEWAEEGITANAICPGYIATEMVMAVPEKVRDSIVAQIPTGRLGEPEEIARAVVFLVSDDAGFINGSTITANGAQHLV